MPNELTPMQSFQEKLKDKLRDDIASLLPDDVLKEMIAIVVQEEFFDKKKVKKYPHNHYNYDTIEMPSEFTNIITEAVKPLLKEHIKQLFEERKVEIATHINSLVHEGLVKLTLNAFDEMLSKAITSESYSIGQAIMERIRQGN